MRGVVRALVLSLALVVAGCGSGHRVTTARSPTVPPPQPTDTSSGTDVETGTTSAAPPQSPTSTSTSSYRVYFLRNDKLAAVARPSPSSRAPAGAAMHQLLAGPTAAEDKLGLSSAVAKGQRMTRLEIRNGVAIADFDPMVSPDSAAFAQIVYTLTQFPTVKRVSIVLETQEGAEFTRKDVERFAPPILVDSPAPYERVTSPLRIRGSANTFEAEFRYELRDSGGKVVKSGGVMATSGSGERGTFDEKISFPDDASPTELRVFELSAADGSRIHEVRIPLAS